MSATEIWDTDDDHTLGVHLEEFGDASSHTTDATVTIQQGGFLEFRFKNRRAGGKADKYNKYELHFSMPQGRCFFVDGEECKEVAITVEGDAEMRELKEAMRAFVHFADRHPHLITPAVL